MIGLIHPNAENSRPSRQKTRWPFTLFVIATAYFLKRLDFLEVLAVPFEKAGSPYSLKAGL
jgi:hypothetical protein